MSHWQSFEFNEELLLGHLLSNLSSFLELDLFDCNIFTPESGGHPRPGLRGGGRHAEAARGHCGVIRVSLARSERSQ